MRLLGPRFVSPIVAPTRPRSRAHRARRHQFPLALVPLLDSLLVLVLALLSQFETSGEL